MGAILDRTVSLVLMVIRLTLLAQGKAFFILCVFISIHTTRVGGDSKNEQRIRPFLSLSTHTIQRNQILPAAYLSTFTNLLRC